MADHSISTHSIMGKLKKTEALGSKKLSSLTDMADHSISIHSIMGKLKKTEALGSKKLSSLTDMADHSISTHSIMGKLKKTEALGSKKLSSLTGMAAHSIITISTTRKRKKKEAQGRKKRLRISDVVNQIINTQSMTKQRKIRQAPKSLKRFRHAADGNTTKTMETKLLSKKVKYTSPKTAKALMSAMRGRVLHVWEGYRKESPNNPVFVLVLPNNGAVLSLEDLPESYHKYECVFRHEYEVNKEASTLTNSRKARQMLIGMKERRQLKKTVEQNINKLLKSHVNIEMIGVSSVRSKKYGLKNAKVIRETCIVIYVHVKGVIPIGEEEFPRSIGSFPLDVREGKFIPYDRVPRANEYHQRLLMGCQITRELSGTIGGFLDLPGGGIGVMTCAHVVLTEKERTQYINCRPDQQADLRKAVPWRTLQICQPDQYKDFGVVKDFVLYPGSSSEVGIDAAVIFITNEARLPVSGEFPWDDRQTTAGYGPDNPMEFVSGNCIKIKPELAGCEVVKFGATTGITRGLLAHTSLFVKRSHVPDLAFKDVMYNQMEVQPLQGFDGFAQKGDSGSLVLMAYKGNRKKLVAVGMVVGGTTTNTTVVTPILNILKEFHLPNMCFKTFRHCPRPKETSSLAELKKEQNKQGKEIKQLKQNIQEYRKDHKKQVQQQRKEQKKMNQKVIDLVEGLKTYNAKTNKMIQNINKQLNVKQ